MYFFDLQSCAACDSERVNVDTSILVQDIFMLMGTEKKLPQAFNFTHLTISESQDQGYIISMLHDQGNIISVLHDQGYIISV